MSVSWPASGGHQHRDGRERQRDALVHDAHRTAGEADGGGQLVELVGHQRDVGGLQRDGRAGGTHGDPDVGDRQRGGIVDAVADHRYGPALRGQLGHGGALVPGQQLGADVVDAAGGADGAGDPVVVARQHDYALHGRDEHPYEKSR